MENVTETKGLQEREEGEVGGGGRYALCRHWHGAWKKMSEGTDMQGTPPTDLRAQSLKLRHFCVRGHLRGRSGSLFVYPCQHATWRFLNGAPVNVCVI